MQIVTNLLVYLCIWWLIFFMVLPWGITYSHVPSKGTAKSAPQNPRLWLKVGITTFLAFLGWAIYFWAWGIKMPS